MGRNQHVRDAIAIQELTQKVKQMEKALEDEHAARTALESGAETSSATKKLSLLERSSLEAYAFGAIGIVLAVWPMNWQVRVLLFAILCIIGADVAWRSPLTYLWPKFLKLSLVLVIVGGIGWAAYENVTVQYKEQEFPPGKIYVISWGPVDPPGTVVLQTDSSGNKIVGGSKMSHVIVDGDSLIQFAANYRLMAVNFHWDGKENPYNVRSVSRSAVYDIVRGPIEIGIPWNSDFIDGFKRGGPGSDYALLLVPRNLSASSVSCIQDAIDAGAVVLQEMGGF